MTRYCPCGREWHFTNKLAESMIEELVKAKGETVVMRLDDGRGWRVPRVWIALHGIKAKTLPKVAKERGFEEV
jgi:hypothetical protein